MVQQTDLSTIVMLNGELRQIMLALELFDAGGRIVNLTVSSAPNEPLARTTMVQTATMAYPPQMITAIKGYLSDRERDIRGELAALGVTGVAA